MKNVEDILAQCLMDIESGKATVEQCLERYPEQAGILQPLLRTAAAVRQAPVVEPSAAFQGAAQTRLLNMIAARQQATAPAASQPAPKQANQRRSVVLLKVAALAVLASFLLAGTAFAARDSMPDSAFYPVKLTVERVQLAVSPSDARRARLFVQILDRRALEAATMIRNGNVERSLQTNLEYIRMLREMEKITQRLPADRPESKVLLTFASDRLAAQEAMFERAQATSPIRARPLFRPTLAQIQRTQESIKYRLERLSR